MQNQDYVGDDHKASIENMRPFLKPAYHFLTLLFSFFIRDVHILSTGSSFIFPHLGTIILNRTPY